MSIKSYKQYIDRCEVVSFDVFDTLIKRNVRTPKDVFSLVEREALKRFGVSMEGFRDKRVWRWLRKPVLPASQPVQAAPTPLAEPSLLSNRLEPVLTI